MGKILIIFNVVKLLVEMKILKILKCLNAVKVLYYVQCDLDPPGKWEV